MRVVEKWASECGWRYRSLKKNFKFQQASGPAAVVDGEELSHLRVRLHDLSAVGQVRAAVGAFCNCQHMVICSYGNQAITFSAVRCDARWIRSHRKMFESHWHSPGGNRRVAMSDASTRKTVILRVRVVYSGEPLWQKLAHLDLDFWR